MTARRSTRVIAALLQAKGRWVNSEALAAQLGIGRPQVAAAISEARAALSKEMGGITIESHKFRGVGWRIAPAAVPIVTDAPADPQPPIDEDAAHASAEAEAEATLLPNGRAMLARLRQAEGDYVDGRALAELCDVEIGRLSNVARQINHRLPWLLVEGKRGSGYRLVKADDAPAVRPAPRREPARAAHRNAIELLDALLPATAEKLRSVALEAGETLTETLFRVIEYGIEVHHDLIREGQHPLQLRRAA